MPTDPPASVVPLIRQYGLLVLLPDLVRSERAWSAIVRRVAPLRLTVVAATALQLRRDQYSALYAGSVVKQHNRGRASAAWLGQQLAQLDMSIPLLVRTPLPVDLTALLTEWKGPSGYGTRNAGDLREASATSDRCVSLFHTCDSAAELYKDAMICYGEELVTGLLQGRPARSVPLESVLALRLYVPADDEPHPYDLVLRTLVRGIALLAFDALIDLPCWVAQDRVQKALGERARLAALRDRAVLGELPTALAAVSAQLPAAGARVTGPAVLVQHRSVLLELLHRLGDVDQWGAELAAGLIDACRANGLYLDVWERHRLTTALVFYAHNAH